MTKLIRFYRYLTNLLSFLMLFSVHLYAETSKTHPLTTFSELNINTNITNHKNFPKTSKAILTELQKLKKGEHCSSSIKKTINNLKTSRGFEDEHYLFTGICYELESDTIEASSNYKKSLKYKNSQSFILYRLAYIEALGNSCKTSIKHVNEAEWLDSNLKEPLLLIKAYCFTVEKNLKDAKHSLDKLDSLNPNSASSLTLRKNMLLEEINNTKDPTKLKELKERYNSLLPRMLSLDPENQIYAEQYAKILLSQGHPINNPSLLKQGLTLVRKFSLKDNKPNDAFVLLETQFLEKQGKSSESLTLLNQLKDKYGLSPTLEFKRKELDEQLNPDKDED